MATTPAKLDPGFVKAQGDLSGPATDSFRMDLQRAIETHSPGIHIDLARPSVIDGRAVAAILMARNSAEAAARTFQVRFDHDWKEFELMTGLADVVVP